MNNQKNLPKIKFTNGQDGHAKVKPANGQDGHAMKKRTCVDQGGGVGGTTRGMYIQQRSLKVFLKASENGGYLLLYSPTTCSPIGVAELGVGVCCSVARRAPSAAAAPRRLGCSDAYNRPSMSQSFHARPRQSFVSLCRTVHSTFRHTNPCLALIVRATRLARACLRLCAPPPAHPHA